MNHDIRTQTTISVSKEALEAIDEVSRATGVSRSKLFDMAARQYVQAIRKVPAGKLRALIQREITQPTVHYEATHKNGKEPQAKSQPSGERPIDSSAIRSTIENAMSDFSRAVDAFQSASQRALETVNAAQQLVSIGPGKKPAFESQNPGPLKIGQGK